MVLQCTPSWLNTVLLLASATTCQPSKQHHDRDSYSKLATFASFFFSFFLDASFLLVSYNTSLYYATKLEFRIDQKTLLSLKVASSSDVRSFIRTIRLAVLVQYRIVVGVAPNFLR